MSKPEVIHAHGFVFVRAKSARELSLMRMEADIAWATGRVHRGFLLDFEHDMSVYMAKRTNAARLAVCSVNKVTRDWHRRDMWYWQWKLWLLWMGAWEIQTPQLEHKIRLPRFVNPYAILYPEIATPEEMNEMRRIDNEGTITNGS